MNGIYLLFEKNETAHGVDRIVRVGTHNGDDQLRSRLKQHFINENKDRSIFRKNIGRAILNKDKDDFLKQWEIDLTSRDAKKKYADKIDSVKQHNIERKVSEYIRNNFSFVVIPVTSKKERLSLESKLISTISHCDQCKPSDEWLGNYSTKPKIRQSGLWQEQKLYGSHLSEEDYERVIELSRKQLCL
jgi:hypothetical protein